jgi:CBS-domain-containing membrane protein
VRCAIVGGLLAVAGATVLSHSAWTLPVAIVGLLMVIVAWIGRRLEGRFAIEWSDAGAGFEMHARVKAPAPMPARRAALAEATLEPPIEGEAHTVEIDTHELKALIEAAERGPANGARFGAGTHATASA